MENPAKKKTSLMISISLILVFVTITPLSFQVFEEPGWYFYDIWQRQFSLAKAEKISLVMVDQHSINQLSEKDGFNFPWPRQFFGIVSNLGKRFSATAIGYDILFTEPSSYGEEDDLSFAEMIRTSNIPIVFPAASPNGLVKSPVKVLRNNVNVSLGRVDVQPSQDGVFRNVPNFWGNSEDASFAYRLFQKSQPSSIDIPPSQGWIKFYQQNAFNVVSFYDLILAYRALEEEKTPPESIKSLQNTIWIVGYSAPGLHDLKSIPTDAKAPGPVIQASRLANLLSQVELKPLPTYSWSLALAFLLCLITVTIANFATSPLPGSFGVVAAGTIFPLMASILLWHFGQWLNPIPLGLSGLASGALLLTWNFHNHWKDRLKFAKSLEHSMSSDMVKLIKSGDIEVSRFGEKRVITIMFSDLAGFTTLSEKISAHDLVEILNSYLDVVVDLIVEHNGYVDKFIGDAVMSFWGAPVIQSNHADLGVQTALDFHNRMKIFNDSIGQKYNTDSELITRVGIHTGEAIVGNIGAHSRYNYTAIGDTVNLASRLEGLGKKYDCLLLLSEDTVKHYKDLIPPGIVEIDTVIVKGRTQSTKIYTYVDPSHTQDIKNYEAALKFYYKGQWKEAKNLFQNADKVNATKVMLRRVEQAIEQGQLPQWKNGAWSHDSK